MKIIYSEVCENDDVVNELKKFLTVKPNIDTSLYYGSGYVIVKGTEVDFHIDRHCTHAGNRYIQFSKRGSRFKIPFNKEFNTDKAIKAIEKIAQEYIDWEKRCDDATRIRQNIYNAFKKANKNDRIKLNYAINAGEYTLEGCVSKYLTLHLSPDTVEQEFKEAKDHYIKYKNEQFEISQVRLAMDEILKAS
jgi:hypothetical protein